MVGSTSGVGVKNQKRMDVRMLSGRSQVLKRCDVASAVVSRSRQKTGWQTVGVKQIGQPKRDLKGAKGEEGPTIEVKTNSDMSGDVK